MWASSGPFPLSTHYGLYKRGRDPPTNPSRHLKKERIIIPLKWMLKEDQGRRPTAASAATTAAAPSRAAAVLAAETAASPCLVCYSSACRLPAATAAAPSRAAAVLAAETAASPCLVRYSSACRLPDAAAVARSQHHHSPPPHGPPTPTYLPFPSCVTRL